MRTKHLFFAAAMPLVFAACSSEELEVMAPNAGNSSDARPLVEVKLNFQKGGDGTRVNYNGTGYSWTSKDEIGALLMDEMVSKNRPFGASKAAWDSESWVEHYGLVNYIHTAYPFTYDTQKKEWVAPSKLQEGNYFFVSPHKTYGGERQAIHRIDNQVQVGGTKKAMNDAIAANQYFIGYAQVKAGTENKEVIKDITMTATLAPIKVTLRNIGTQAKKIKQVVVRGNQLYSALTIDPTAAAYGKYNLDNNKLTWGTPVPINETGEEKVAPSFFNYANLIGNKGDVYTGIHFNANDAVYNIEPNGGTYKPGDALRALVAPVFETTNDYEKQAVLNFEDAVVIPAVNGEIDFAVMVNTIDLIGTGEDDYLVMDIIMEEGQIANIDLTEAKTEKTELGKPNTALVNIGLTSLKPSTKDELIIQFDNNSVDKADAITVTDASILENFIKWNQENTRVNTVTLMKNITFTKTMYEALKASKPGNTLAIQNTEKDNAKLTIADDVPMDVLALFNQESTTAPIVIKGVRELTKEIAGVCELNIENEGSLTIADDLTVNAELTNNGSVTISGTVKFAATGCNNGDITVDGVMNCAGKFTNNAGGVITNNGEINNLINAAQGLVKVGKDAEVKTHMNVDNGILDITANFDSKITDQVSHNIVYTLEGTIELSKLRAKSYLKKLTISGGTVEGSSKSGDNCRNNASIAEIIVDDKGGTLEGIWDNDDYSKFTYTSFVVNGDLSVKNFVLDNVNVNKGTTTVSGQVTAGVIKLGSVNTDTFTPETATLVVSENALLKVSDIKKHENVEVANAVVRNYGTVTTIAENGSISVDELDWYVNPFNPNASGITTNTTTDKNYHTETVYVDLVLDGTQNATQYSEIITSENKNLNDGDVVKTAKIKGNTLKKLFAASLGKNKSEKDETTTKTYYNGVYQSESKVTNGYHGVKYIVKSLTINVHNSNINGVNVFAVNNNPGQYKQADVDNGTVNSNFLNKYKDDNHYNYLTLLAGDNLILDGKQLCGLSGDYPVTIEKLTLKGNNAGIYVNDNTVRTVMTVDEFDYSGVESGVVIYGCYIEMDKTIQVGTQNSVTFKNDVTRAGNGYLIATKLGETTKKIKWHFSTCKWHNFDDK